MQKRGGDYQVHDLLLDFAKSEINMERFRTIKEAATSRQAQYLGRLDVVHTYSDTGELAGGVYSLMALWRSLEELSGDTGLEVKTYTTSLGALERGEATSDVASTYGAVARLFDLQVRLPREAVTPSQASCMAAKRLTGLACFASLVVYTIPFPPFLAPGKLWRSKTLVQRGYERQRKGSRPRSPGSDCSHEQLGGFVASTGKILRIGGMALNASNYDWKRLSDTTLSVNHIFPGKRLRLQVLFSSACVQASSFCVTLPPSSK